MNFCSNCGSEKLITKIPEGDHVPRTICSNCETVHYVNPVNVVGCVITDAEGRVMLAKRGIEPRKDYWNLPAGFMEMYETIQEGALREVFEETGAHVNLGDLLVIYNVPHAGQVYHIFYAELGDSSYHITPESTEIKFFAEAEIPWGDIAFSSNEFALRTFFNNRKEGGRNVKIGTYIKKSE